jgi:hypothetical protein
MKRGDPFLETLTEGLAILVVADRGGGVGSISAEVV